MFVRISPIALSFVLLSALSASAQSNTSLYTNLVGPQCRTLKLDESGTGSYLGQCRGVAGYKLLVEEGDIRQNLIVVTPAEKKKSLDLWSVVGSSFSSLGAKAEWRMKRQGKRSVPVGLIVRYNLANPEDSTKSISYLVVARISPDAAQVCVTDVISPGADQNAKAREGADNSETKRCKVTPN